MTDESGQITVLTLGFALVVFAVAGLAVDGTKAFIARRSLQNTADAAAVSGAGAIDAARYYRSGGSDIRLHLGRAEDEALRVLSQRSLAASADVLTGEGGVRVLLRTRVATSFLRLVGIDAIEVSATAAAEPFPQRVPIGR